MELFEATIDDGLRYVRAGRNEVVPTVDSQLVDSLCSVRAAPRTARFAPTPIGAAPATSPLLDAASPGMLQLFVALLPEAQLDLNADADALKPVVASLFAYSYIWSVGA